MLHVCNSISALVQYGFEVYQAMYAEDMVARRSQQNVAAEGCFDC